jgi:hypothetical protein
LKGKLCGLKSKGKRQVTEQRNDGLTKTSSKKCVKLLHRLRFVPGAAKLTSTSFTSTKKVGEQPHIVVSATKNDAMSVGMLEAGLIGGLHAPTSTVSRNSSSLICIANKKENAQYVGMSHRLKERCMSIIAMRLKKSGVFYATGATLALGRSKKTSRFFQKQSVI